MDNQMEVGGMPQAPGAAGMPEPQAPEQGAAEHAGCSCSEGGESSDCGCQSDQEAAMPGAQAAGPPPQGMPNPGMMGYAPPQGMPQPGMMGYAPPQGMPQPGMMGYAPPQGMPQPGMMGAPQPQGMPHPGMMGYAPPQGMPHPGMMGYAPPQGMPYPGPMGGPPPGKGPSGCDGHDHLGAPPLGTPFGPQPQPGAPFGQMFGMVNDIMNGKTDPTALAGLLDTSDTRFWKGLIVGAALTFLLTNTGIKDSVGNMVGGLFGGGKEPEAK